MPVMENTTERAREARLTAASTGTAWEVSVPIRKSFLQRVWPWSGPELNAPSPPSACVQDLPKGIEESKHLWGPTWKVRQVSVVHSSQDWTNLRKGDLVLAYVGTGEYQIKLLTSKPRFFEYKVGPYRDELLTAYWTARTRSLSQLEWREWESSRSGAAPGTRTSTA
ncbi:MAG: hypothetical protein OXI74_05780 [Rhodospirillaceae bacterium]|nr:hypothetical protein [Rhodospirillaceae bacterium]